MYVFFFKQKTAYDLGLGIPAEPLFRSGGMKTYNWEGVNPDGYFLDKLETIPSALPSFQKLFQVSATRSEERFSRNAETDLVCRLLLEKKKKHELMRPI